MQGKDTIVIQHNSCFLFSNTKGCTPAHQIVGNKLGRRREGKNIFHIIVELWNNGCCRYYCQCESKNSPFVHVNVIISHKEIKLLVFSIVYTSYNKKDSIIFIFRLFISNLHWEEMPYTDVPIRRGQWRIDCNWSILVCVWKNINICTS